MSDGYQNCYSSEAFKNHYSGNYSKIVWVYNITYNIINYTEGISNAALLLSLIVVYLLFNKL